MVDLYLPALVAAFLITIVEMTEVARRLGVSWRTVLNRRPSHAQRRTMAVRVGS